VKFSVFVGQLDPETTDKDLYDAFKHIGDVVECRVIKENNMPKGYAFVDFGTEQGQEKALNEMRGALVRGRAVTVERPRKSSAWVKEGDDGGPHDGTRIDIYVGNTPADISGSELQSTLEMLLGEPVQNFRVGSGTYCFMSFYDMDKAEEAMKALDGARIRDNCLSVRRATNKGDKEKQERLYETVKMALGGQLSLDPTQLYQLMKVFRKLYIGNLSQFTKGEHLRQAFKKFGEIQECYVVTDPSSGRSKGYAFIMFATIRAATNALTRMKYKNVNGDSIKVQRAKANKEVVTLASTAGLADLDGEPSPMFLSIIENMYASKPQQLPENVTYFMDPATGQTYAMDSKMAEQYLQQMNAAAQPQAAPAPQPQYAYAQPTPQPTIQYAAGAQYPQQYPASRAPQIGHSYPPAPPPPGGNNPTTQPAPPGVAVAAPPSRAPRGPHQGYGAYPSRGHRAQYTPY